MKISFVFFILLFSAFCNSSQAQESILDKKITVHYIDASLKEVIQDLSERYDLHFAYSSNQINIKKNII